ncbi:MAG: hypothetical protein IKU86_06920 [Thermoguttaceae bacterium]|nr:hypothetical protein [Thermoguttaceae bacterium]
MPIRNLGPCACCRVGAFPVKAVVTDMKTAYIRGYVENGALSQVLISVVSYLDYDVYYSDGTVVKESHRTGLEWRYNNPSESNDPYWRFGSDRVVEYLLPVEATDANGAIYRAEISVKWSVDGYLNYSGISNHFYIGDPVLPKTLNVANGSLEFAFKKAE